MNTGIIIAICIIAYIMIGAFIGELLEDKEEEIFLITVAWPLIVIVVLIYVIAYIPRLIACKLKELEGDKE